MAVVFPLWLVAFTSLGESVKPKETPFAHDEYVYMIRFSPDGKTLATAGGDNVARIWNWSKRAILHTLEHDAAVYGAVFSPSKDLLATGSGDGKVALWDANTGKLLAQRQEHADAVYCLNFAGDGKRLATIGGDGKKGDTQCRIWSVPSLQVAEVFPGHDRPAYGVLFGPQTSESSALVTSGGDKLIHFYAHPADKRRTWRGHTSDVYRCCFAPDGKQLASTGQDGTVRLWDVATGESETLFKGRDPTYDVTYSSDGHLLAAVADDGFVRIWSAKSNEMLFEMKADKEGLYSVVFTPHQSSVLTAGVRGKVYECPVPKLSVK